MSTTSAEFATALLSFLTFGRSVLDVARNEATRHDDGARHLMKHRLEDAEKEPLVTFFIGARNRALKENRYFSMRAEVSVDAAVAITLQIVSDDVLISPSRGIDESRESRREAVLEIGIRGEKSQGADSAQVRQEFYFKSGPSPARASSA